MPDGTIARQTIPATKPAAEKPKPKPKPVGPPPSAEKLRALTKQLNSDEFKVREHAQVELTGLARNHPGPTFDTVLSNYMYSVDPEARYRLRSVLYSVKMAEFQDAPKGFVGIMMYPSQVIAPDGELTFAIQIRQVVEDSPAQRHDLKVFDQILEIDGKGFDTLETATNEFANYIMGKAPGETVELKIRRQNKDSKIDLKLDERPKSVLDNDPRIQLQLDAKFKTWLDENTARLREKK